MVPPDPAPRSAATGRRLAMPIGMPLKRGPPILKKKKGPPGGGKKKHWGGVFFFQKRAFGFGFGL